MKTKLKNRPLPACLSGAPGNERQAERRKVGYYYSVRGKYVYLHSTKYPDVFPEGRRVGRVSKQFPDESEEQMHLRLWHKVPDDAEVRPSGKDAAQEERPEPPEAVEHYTGDNAPEPRVNGKMRRIVAPAGPAPRPPQDAKWRTLRLWSKELFREFAGRNEFLTVLGLVNLAQRLGVRDSLRQKIVRRLRGLYAQEFANEELYTQTMLTAPVETVSPLRLKHPPRSSDDKSASKPGGDSGTRLGRSGAKATQSKGRDRFGNKLGTGTAGINAALSDVPKSCTRLKEETGASNVSSHLCALLRRGLVEVVVIKGERHYKVKESECPEASSPTTRAKRDTSPNKSKSRKSRSPESSDSARKSGSKSSRPKSQDGRRSDTAKERPRNPSGRSTRPSAKAKPAKSGKRPSRKG